MAKRFTRNIRSIKNIEKQPKYTNKQNDLLSDKKDVYVRNQDKYEKITGGVKEVNGETPDSDGYVEIDTGAMTVNDEKPDKNGNVTIDTGVKTVANIEPDENGNVNLETKNIEDINLYVRNSELDESLEGIESGYKNYTDNAVDDLATKQELDKKLEDKAEKSEITDLNNKVENYYDNLYEKEVLYDGINKDYGIYFDPEQSFDIDPDRAVEKLTFWWSRHDPGEDTRNYAFSNTIVDGDMLRIMQSKNSEIRVVFKPIESQGTTFKKINFTQSGVVGDSKNTDTFELDNKLIVLRQLTVTYRNE